MVLALVEHYFPSSKAAEKFVRGLDAVPSGKLPSSLLSGAPGSVANALTRKKRRRNVLVCNSFFGFVAGMPAREADAISYVLCTRVGPGPAVLPDSESLIGPDGYKKHK